MSPKVSDFKFPNLEGMNRQSGFFTQRSQSTVHETESVMNKTGRDYF